jgi:DNA polymerase III epsilon subunit-like protein
MVLIKFFWDTESTGFSVYKEQITEIASVAIRADTGVEISTFQSYVKPSIPIGVIASEKTGITAETVANASGFALVCSQFSAWITETLGKLEDEDIKAVFVAHNGEKFDLRILFEECARHARPFVLERDPGVFVLDTLEWCRKGLGRKNGNRQPDMYLEFTGKPLENAHSAVADTRALALLTNTYLKVDWENPRFVRPLKSFVKAFDMCKEKRREKSSKTKSRKRKHSAKDQDERKKKKKRQRLDTVSLPTDPHPQQPDDKLKKLFAILDTYAYKPK